MNKFVVAGTKESEELCMVLAKKRWELKIKVGQREGIPKSYNNRSYRR